MLGDHAGVDAAAHVPERGDAQEARRDRRDEIVEHAIGHGLVECTLVAERVHVEFQALEFDIAPVGHEFQDEAAEIRLPGDRAKAGEFRDLDAHQVVARGAGIGKGGELGGSGFFHLLSGAWRRARSRCPGRGRPIDDSL